MAVCERPALPWLPDCDCCPLEEPSAWLPCPDPPSLPVGGLLPPDDDPPEPDSEVSLLSGSPVPVPPVADCEALADGIVDPFVAEPLLPLTFGTEDSYSIPDESA